MLLKVKDWPTLNEMLRKTIQKNDHAAAAKQEGERLQEMYKQSSSYLAESVKHMLGMK